MAVSTKRRRKIVCLGQDYVWYVNEDNDFCGRFVLHIISHDKMLILSYPLQAQTPYVVSQGRFFQNYPNTGTWNRYLSPFKEIFPVTPQFVSEIILWAVNERDAVSVEWNNHDICL